jgi:recombination protein RecR
MGLENPLTHLVNQLSKFPGIGEKSAQRLAFFLLSQSEADVRRMAEAMVHTREKIKYCKACFNISFQDTCHICLDPKRERSQLCIVASPKDIFAFERSGEFKGTYHVLGGLISPIDGVHPDMLRIQELLIRCRQGAFSEVIMAINATIEGDATMLYLMELLSSFDVKVSKLAYGLPVGADIDYADELTLQKALRGRLAI